MDPTNNEAPKTKKPSMINSVLNLKDFYGRGRARILMSTCFDFVAGSLAGGVFYTSFLLYYDMDKSSIGFLTFIPYITCMLSIFSPMILERFQKRKAILITAKLIQCFINYVGIALIPTLITDKELRLTVLAILIILSTSITQLFTSGWNAWHANYLQDHVRVNYFFIANCTHNMFSNGIALIVSFVADIFADTPNEIILLTVIRYVAFGLMVLDAMVWIFQKEFPYEKTASKIKLSNVFTLPFKNKKFMMVMFIIILYNFFANLPNATLNAYLLEDVGVKYTLMTAINACYFLFFFVFTGMWNAVICKFNRYYALGIGFIVHAVSCIIYAFVAPGAPIICYIAARLIQHVTGILLSSVMSSILYDHLPNADRTNYLSFNFIVANASVFLALMFDTIMAALFNNGALSFFGTPVYSTQIMLCASGIGLFFVARLCMKWSNTLVK